MHPSEDSGIIAYAAWPTERLAARLAEIYEIIPEHEGIWICEDLFWALVFHLGKEAQMTADSKHPEVVWYFEFADRNVYCG